MQSSPGLLIAGGVLAIYVLIGQVILFAIYTLFDRLSQDRDPADRDKATFKDKDPALWTEQDVKRYLQDRRSEGETVP